ncbi:MAG TPA: multidrug transporter subunit MdtN [Burkholderiales bacterium]|nr:multidrug transporter subunit MdtN [Burkholderiales bacterium]
MAETSRAAPGPAVRRNLGRAVGLAILAAAIGLAVYVVYYLDQSPRTDDAYVRADTIGVAAQVSGRIVNLRVHDNQAVKQGDVLFEIDPEPYRYALQRARAALDSLEKQIGLTQRDVRAQQFAATAARANIERAKAQANQAADTLGRIEPLLAKEYVTAEQVDQARTAKRSADAALEVARRDADRAAAAVSGVDALVAKLGELRAAVATAEYDLKQTVVRAPFDGRVIDLDIAQGEYAATGRRLFTLIDARNWYVIANFRETQLREIRPGMTAEVYLMSDPRRRFAGTVHSIGFGVFPEDGGASANGLPRVPRSINWVRVAQRFPVRIRVGDPPADLFRIGASAVALVPPESAQEKHAAAHRPIDKP